MGVSPEGHRSPGKLDVAQEGIIKGSGLGNRLPPVLEHELERKKADLAKQGAFAETSGTKKKRAYGLWKKGQAT